jgi:RNA polymerase sigma-70 factor (ECF subfamily)
MSASVRPLLANPSEPEELDDLTLRRAQRGDQAAFRALVLRYQRPVFALLGRMLARSQPGLVEDLAQETFLRVFRALPNFSLSGPARLSTWILSISARLALDELRKHAPQTMPLEEMIELPSGERTESGLEQRSLGEAISRAVSQLSPGFRAVFLLREAHDLSYEEIAQALQIDVGTVKSRLLRARAALRVALAGVLHD